MRNARHKDEGTAKTYFKDSESMREEISDSVVLQSCMDGWPFRSNLIENACVQLQRLQAYEPSNMRLNTLAGAAEYFVTRMLGVSP
jgi:hypothetical protein